MGIFHRDHIGFHMAQGVPKSSPQVQIELGLPLNHIKSDPQQRFRFPFETKKE